MDKASLILTTKIGARRLSPFTNVRLCPFLPRSCRRQEPLTILHVRKALRVSAGAKHVLC